MSNTRTEAGCKKWGRKGDQGTEPVTGGASASSVVSDWTEKKVVASGREDLWELQKILDEEKKAA